MPLPTGWKNTNGVLSNPVNSFVVKHGFADHILAAPQWDSVDVPLGNEYVVPTGTPLEYSNPGWGAGAATRSQQVFQKHMLAAIQQTANGAWVISEEYVGREMLWLRNNYLAQLQHIADLQKQLAAATPGPKAGVTVALNAAQADLNKAQLDVAAAQAANK